MGRLEEIAAEVEALQREKDRAAQDHADAVRAERERMRYANEVITRLHQPPDMSEFDPRDRPLTSREFRMMKQRGELRKEAARQTEEQRLAREERYREKAQEVLAQEEGGDGDLG